MNKIFLIFFLSILFSCSKKNDALIVDNTKLYGRWQWFNTTYYLRNANTLSYYSDFRRNSDSHMTFSQNGEMEIQLYGTAVKGSYSYTPANSLLTKSFTFVHKEIDTVKVLTPNILILHIKIIDTPSFNPFIVREFLRIDSLMK